MSAPVDVLAVMHNAADLSARTPEARAAMFEARAAVAELIEAANRAAIASVRGNENWPGTIRNADLDALRAAVARVGGAL